MDLDETSFDLMCHESLLIVSEDEDNACNVGRSTPNSDSLIEKLAAVNISQTVEQTSPKPMVDCLETGEGPTTAVLMTACDSEDDDAENAVVMEMNVYRLHDNVINLNESMDKLLRVEDEKGPHIVVRC